MAKIIKLGERWQTDRLIHVAYPASPANQAIMQLAYYLGARATLQILAATHRDKDLAALKSEIRHFLLAAGIVE